MHIVFYMFSCNLMLCAGTILKDILNEDYDSSLVPKVNGQPVTVNVSIFVLNLRSVRPKDMTFTADLFVHQTWFDHRLKFPSNVINDNHIALHGSWSSKIWTPDVYFKNGIAGEISTDQFKTSYFVFYENRSVFMSSRVTVDFVCEMNFQKYPHDSHVCKISLMSLAYRTSSMILRWKQFKLSSRLHNTDFNISHVSEEQCDKKYEVGSYSCVSGTVSLQRNSGHFYTKYLPSTTIVIASFASFWIPTNSYPARASVVVTSMLALITQQLQVTSDIQTSYFVSINIWMNICTTIVFCCLLEFAVALVWENKQKRHREIERRASKIGQVLKKFEKHERNPIDQVSKYLFPGFFLLSAIIYYLVVAYSE